MCDMYYTGCQDELDELQLVLDKARAEILKLRRDVSIQESREHKARVESDEKAKENHYLRQEVANLNNALVSKPSREDKISNPECRMDDYRSLQDELTKMTRMYNDARMDYTRECSAVKDLKLENEAYRFYFGKIVKAETDMWALRNAKGG